MLIYSNLTDEFKILDYTLSHSQMLIRSLKNRQRDYNIDILFKPVEAIMMKSKINGLEIYHDDSAIQNPAVMTIGFTLEYDYKVFVLKDAGGNKHYINAMAVGVYHNKLEILDSGRVGFVFEDLGESKLWYNGHAG